MFCSSNVLIYNALDAMKQTISSTFFKQEVGNDNCDCLNLQFLDFWPGLLENKKSLFRSRITLVLQKLRPALFLVKGRPCSLYTKLH